MKTQWKRELLVCVAILTMGAIAGCGGGDDAGGTSDATDGLDSDAGVLTCQQDSECLDNDMCNGTETCSADGVCVAGTPLTCTASDACHTSVCNPGTGCEEALIDADEDGVASIDLGSCGSDCDDSDKDRAPGLPEICDGQDNNCDSSDDDVATRWYADCDSDGFSEALEPSELSCDPGGPDKDHDLCLGSGSPWVTDLAETDCCVLDDRYYPGSEEFVSELLTVGEVFACEDYDSNCDDTEELRFTETNVVSGSCLIGALDSCGGEHGWTGTVVPDCGEEAEFNACTLVLGSCERRTFNRKQECR